MSEENIKKIFEEMVKLGHAEVIGRNPSGEPLYALTEAGRKYFIEKSGGVN